MITKKDLQKGTNLEFLYCSICGTHASANANDYFLMADDEVFKCCKIPMVLALNKTTIEIIKD